MSQENVEMLVEKTVSQIGNQTNNRLGISKKSITEEDLDNLLGTLENLNMYFCVMKKEPCSNSYLFFVTKDRKAYLEALDSYENKGYEIVYAVSYTI